MKATASIAKLSIDEDEMDVHSAPTAVRTVNELIGMGIEVKPVKAVLPPPLPAEATQPLASISGVRLSTPPVRFSSSPPGETRYSHITSRPRMPSTIPDNEAHEPTRFSQIDALLAAPKAAPEVHVEPSKKSHFVRDAIVFLVCGVVTYAGLVTFLHR